MGEVGRRAGRRFFSPPYMAGVSWRGKMKLTTQSSRRSQTPGRLSLHIRAHDKRLFARWAENVRVGQGSSQVVPCLEAASPTGAAHSLTSAAIRNCSLLIGCRRHCTALRMRWAASSQVKDGRMRPLCGSNREWPLKFSAGGERARVPLPRGSERANRGGRSRTFFGAVPDSSTLFGPLSAALTASRSGRARRRLRETRPQATKSA